MVSSVLNPNVNSDFLYYISFFCNFIREEKKYISKLAKFIIFVTKMTRDRGFFTSNLNLGYVN